MTKPIQLPQTPLSTSYFRWREVVVNAATKHAAAKPSPIEEIACIPGVEQQQRKRLADHLSLESVCRDSIAQEETSMASTLQSDANREMQKNLQRRLSALSPDGSTVIVNQMMMVLEQSKDTTASRSTEANPPAIAAAPAASLPQQDVMHPAPNYVHNNPKTFSARRRCGLVSWLLNVSMQCSLTPATFFLAVAKTDEYLSTITSRRLRLKSVAITALMLAGRETKDNNDISLFTCLAWTGSRHSTMDQLLNLAVRHAVWHSVVNPTSYDFLTHMLVSVNAPKSTADAAMFFLDVSAHDAGMLHFLPSRVASAALLMGSILCRYSQQTVEGNASLQADAADHCVGGSAVDLAPRAWGAEHVRCSRGVCFDEIAPIAAQLLASSVPLRLGLGAACALERKHLCASRGAVVQMRFPSYILPPDAATVTVEALAGVKQNPTQVEVGAAVTAWLLGVTAGMLAESEIRSRIDV